MPTKHGMHLSRGNAFLLFLVSCRVVCWKMGARQLRPVLMHLKREVTKAQQGQPGPPHLASINTTSVAMLESFFALSWARFGQGWRPDVPPHLDR